MNNHVLHTLARTESTASTRPPRHTALRQAAESLSRRNIDMAILELFSEGLQRLSVLAYEQDEDGYVNIDNVTHKLLIPALWGRAGYKKWSFTRGESEVLREMIQERQAQIDSRPPGLWQYDRTRKRWFLNLFDFDTLADAHRYWQRYPLTVQELRRAYSRRSRATR